MIARLKSFLKRHWPRLRLRTILFGVLMFTTALPLLGTIFFRVYETALVQRTESELIMQGAVLAAAYAEALRLAEGGGSAAAPAATPSDRSTPSQIAPVVQTSPAGSRPLLHATETFKPVYPKIDISSASIYPDRPAARPAAKRPAPSALKAGAMVEPILRQATRTTLASARIVDAGGVVVAGRQEKGLSLAHVSEVRSALAGRHASALRRKAGYKSRYALEFVSRAASTRVFYATPASIDGRVVGAVLLSRSPRSLFKGLYEDTGKIAIAAALLFAIILAIAALLSRSITRPVELLADSTRQVASGDLSLPDAPPTAALEIQQLFADLRDMAQTIDQRSRYIRNFAAAVSHEFKTPLSGIRGAIELLQDHESKMSDDERAQFLANVSADAGRLDKLVTRLLQLARADTFTPSGEASAPDKILTALQASFAARKLQVVLADAKSSMPVAISADALETIFVNLLNNSLHHGASRVDIAASPGPRAARFVLSDNGPGIAPEDRARVFTPFFTTRREEGGTGLGLAIARALCAAHDGSIELMDRADGAAFEVVLPLAADPVDPGTAICKGD